MRARVASLAAVLPVVIVAPAAAAAPWSPPQTLSQAHEFVDPVALAFAPDGTGVASWTYQDGTDANATTGADRATRAAGASAFGTHHRLVAPRRTARAIGLVGLVPERAGRALRVTVQRRHLDPLRADAFALRANGRVIAAGPQMLRATLAANARGDVAVAWWERARRSELFVAVRRHGRGFGAPQRIATHGFGDVAVAVGPRGDVLAAWESLGVIRVRTRAPGGARFGAATVVARRGTLDSDVEAGLSRRGRAIVAWGAQARDEGGAGRITDAAAIRPPGGRRFAVSVLDRQPKTVIAQPVYLSVDPSGRATFAWTGWDGGHRRVRVATAAAGGGFSPAQDVSPPGADAVAGGVAGCGGRRALTWVLGSPDDGGAIEAAFADAGQGFGPPELVSAGPESRVPRVAFDPLTGRPTVVWSERPVAGAARTVARAATRG